MDLRLAFPLIVLLAMNPAGAGAATPVAFAVVVHQSNPTQSMRLDDLRAFFRGAVTRWPNQSHVVLAQRDAASSSATFLTRKLLKTSWMDYQRSLASLEFRGEEPVTVRVLNSDPAACKFVFNVPAALALIEASSLSSPECRSVRALSIEGRMPDQEGYSLK